MSSLPEKPVRWGCIIHYLMTHPRGWRVEDIKRTFEISDRTWRKDRKQLMDHFSPFQDEEGNTLLEEVEEGPYKRIRLRRSVSEIGPSDSGFRARIAAMHMMRQLMSYIEGTPLGEQVEVLMESFEASVPDRHLFEMMMKHADRKLYVVEEAPPKTPEGHSEVLQELLFAILGETQISMWYKSGMQGKTTETRYDLEPLSLVSSRGALYLLGRVLAKEGDKRERTGEDILTFSVSRIDKIKILNESFTYPVPGQFDPKTFLDGHFGVFQRAKTDPIKVELIFAAVEWRVVYLQERQFHPTQKTEVLPDGRLRLTMEVKSMQRVWSWIRSFGDDVEVVQPAGEVPMSHEEEQAWEQRRRAQEEGEIGA